MAEIKVQNESHWHDLRKSVIGSSDIACLYNLSMFKSKFTFWHEKAGNFHQEISSNRIDAGNYLERAIAEMAINKIGGLIINKDAEKLFFLSECKNLGATPDFIIKDKNNNKKILEIKNIDYLQFKQKCPDETPPKQYILQLQHQMHCSGIHQGMIAIFIGGNDLRLFDYDYRPAIGQSMAEKASDFFQSIRDNNPPAIEDQKDYDVVKDIFNYDNRHVDLTSNNEAIAACIDLQEATEKRKHYEKIEKLSKAIILEKMDGYNTAQIGNFHVRITETKESKGTEITAEMVGSFINARKSSLRLNIKEESND